jgi:hypothetical protein
MQTYGKSHRHCSNSIKHNIAQECDNVKCTNLIFLIAPSGKYDLKKVLTVCPYLVTSRKSYTNHKHRFSLLQFQKFAKFATLRSGRFVLSHRCSKSNALLKITIFNYRTITTISNRHMRCTINNY